MYFPTCHSKVFLLFVCMLSLSVMSDSLWPHGLLLAKSLCTWGFSRQEYWSGLPSSPPGDLPNPGIEPRSLSLQADSLSSEPLGKPFFFFFFFSTQFILRWCLVEYISICHQFWLIYKCVTNYYIGFSVSISVHKLCYQWGFPGRSADKEFACNTGDPDSIPGLERYPGKGAWKNL